VVRREDRFYPQALQAGVGGQQIFDGRVFECDMLEPPVVNALRVAHEAGQFHNIVFSNLKS